MKSQRGVALLVSLIILAVAIMLGLSSFHSSLLEERMAGNHRLSVSALHSAEAGVDKMLDTVMSYSYTVGDENTLCDGIDVATYFSFENPYSFSNGGGLERGYLVKLFCSGNSNKIVGVSRGHVLDDDDVELSARKIRVLLDPPGWATVTGMISDKNITINGAKTSVVGTVHSNGDLDIQIKDGDVAGDPVGYLTASGTLKLNNSVVDESVDGVCNTLICASSGTPEVSVPKASDQIDAAFSNIAFEASNFPSGDGAEVVIKSSGSSGPDFVILAHNPSSGACSVDASVLNNSRISGSIVNNASGQQYEHTVYYCPGDLTIKGDFSGAAVMSGRHITHDGASNLGTDASGGEAIDTFMYAIGGIKLNGKTEAYGEFVSDAEPPLKQGNQDVGFFQAGNSKVYGTIISGGDITANGGMEFEAMETGRIRYLSSGRLDSWDEYEDPGLPGLANM